MPPKFPRQLQWQEHQMRMDYDSNDGRGNALPAGAFAYQGFAAQGIKEADPKWTIYEFSYDTDGVRGIELRQVAMNVNWTDRATHTYA